MKKILKDTIIFLFIIIQFISVFLMFFNTIRFDIKNTKNAKCEQICNKNYNTTNYSNFNINFLYGGNKFSLSNFYNENITKIQKDIIGSYESRVKILKFALNNGFNKEESINYAFPEMINFVKFVENKYCYEPQNAEIKAIENTGNITVINSSKGLSLNKSKLYDELLKKIICGFSCDNINLQFFNTDCKINDEYYCDKQYLRGSFKTDFSSSSESRKNNIKNALNSLDGKIIMPNEILSFNNITGERTEKNGYMKAKTIRNGSFYEEFGGGVCQVSTTFYNSAILSNLEVIEVHPHSLPVSYVSPCFDAMVNSGSSDLIVKNTTGSPIIIATSSKNNECLVNIYGVKNDFNIKRVSKKLEEIKNFEKEIITDYKLVGLDSPIGVGEIRVISYGKPGYKAIGCLEYYKNGVLVKTKKIRSDTYNSTKEVLLVG